MNTLVAIDFETANRRRSSACSIGLAWFENGKIVQSEHHFIKPTPNYFEPINVKIHGITKSDTDNALTFDELWKTIWPKIKGRTIVAHNASFDMSVLRKTFQAYNMDLPELTYACSYLLSKYVYPNLVNYQLPTVCNHIEYDFHGHHNAEADAIACINVIQHIIDDEKCSSFEELKKHIQFECGSIYKDGEYEPFSLKQRYLSRKLLNVEPICSTTDIDTDNPFYEKHVLFTGQLSTMTRDEAFRIVLNSGGIPMKSFSRKIDFLVCGTDCLNEEYLRTEKLTKTMKLKSSGIPVEILTESDFVKFIQSTKAFIDITVEMVAQGSSSFLHQNTYNAFLSKRILFSADISNHTNWQLVGNCGGSCCWYEEDYEDMDYFVVSNSDLQNLAADFKSDTVLLFEKNFNQSTLSSDIRYVVPISEDCFYEYINKRNLFSKTEPNMAVLPLEIDAEYRTLKPIIVHTDKL